MKYWIYRIVWLNKIFLLKKLWNLLKYFKFMQNKMKYYGLCTRFSMRCVPRHQTECLKKCSFFFCITEKEYTAQATGWNTKTLSLTKLSN